MGFLYPHLHLHLHAEMEFPVNEHLRSKCKSRTIQRADMHVSFTYPGDEGRARTAGHTSVLAKVIVAVLVKVPVSAINF